MPSPRGAQVSHSPKTRVVKPSREPLTRFRTTQPVSPGSSWRPAFQRTLQSNPALPARQPLARTSFSAFRPAEPPSKSFNLLHLGRIVKGLFVSFRLPPTALLPSEVEP
jgi:hypothetical protein